MDTGKCFHRNRKMLYDMSEFFGQQCVERGLVNSVRKAFYNNNLENTQDKLTFAEHQMRKKGKETFKDELREVIQIEIADPANQTFDDVITALMKHYNVESRVAGNTVSYRHPEYKDKNEKLVAVRGSKLGDLYTRKGIEYELKKKRERELAGAERKRPAEITAEERFIETVGNSGGRTSDIIAGIRTDMGADTSNAREQLAESRERIPTRDVSDAYGTDVPDFDKIYGRYAERHSKSDGNTAKTGKPRKRVHRKSWERD